MEPAAFVTLGGDEVAGVVSSMVSLEPDALVTFSGDEVVRFASLMVKLGAVVELGPLEELGIISVGTASS